MIHKKVLQKYFYWLIEYLLVFPIVLAIGVYTLSKSEIWLFVSTMPFLFIIGLLFSNIVRNQKRRTYIVFGLLVSTILPLLFAYDYSTFVLFFVINSVFTVRGVMYGVLEWNEVLPTTFLWIIGLPIYFFSYFIYKNINTLSDFSLFINLAAIILIIATLFVSNKEQLNIANLSGYRNQVVSKSIQRQNKLLIIGIIAFVFILTNISQIQTSFYFIILNLGQFISWIFSQFELNIERDISTIEVQEEQPIDEGSNVSLFISGITIITLGVFLIYFLRQVRHFFIKIKSKLVNYFNQWLPSKKIKLNELGYIDETENLFNWQQKKKKLSSFLKIERKWNNQTNEEKVRSIYRKLLLQLNNDRFEFKPSLTPKETMNILLELEPKLGKEQLLILLGEVYGDVRYGGKRVNDKNLKILLKLLK